MTKNQKRDLRQEITDKILAALKAGVAPWVKPWTGRAGDGLPINIKTGKAYRGVNVWILSLIQAQEGYPTSEWVTFKQAKALGGSVLPRPDDVEPGNWGHTVIFWKFIKRLDKDGEERDSTEHRPKASQSQRSSRSQPTSATPTLRPPFRRPALRSATAGTRPSTTALATGSRSRTSTPSTTLRASTQWPSMSWPTGPARRAV